MAQSENYPVCPYCFEDKKRGLWVYAYNFFRRKFALHGKQDIGMYCHGCNKFFKVRRQIIYNTRRIDNGTD